MIMLDTINKFAEKGLYIGVYPIYENLRYQWVASVMIKGKRNWLKGSPGCTMSAFNSLEEAFNAAKTYCENYREKKSKNK